MQPYQEEYIVNLKSLSALTLHNRQRSQTFEEYCKTKYGTITGKIISNFRSYL